MKIPKLVYIAGKLTDKDPAVIHDNIGRAAIVSAMVIRVSDREWFPMCPHTMTELIYNELQIESEVNSPVWYEGAIAMLSVSQAMIVLPGYEMSKGTLEEIEYADKKKIPVYYLESIRLDAVGKAIVFFMLEAVLQIKRGEE
jgi:hypothetical protein